MTSTWNSGSTFPSSYENEVKDLPQDGGFTFVDFLPECREPGGLFSKPVFETFRALIDRANNWLRANPQWEVITCESVEFKANREFVDSEKMTYLEYGEAATWYVRGLRLWILGGKENTNKVQELGYMNLVPKQTDESGLFSSPPFETLQEVLDRFNSMNRMNPIPGRILTVESQEMKMSSKKWQVDADRSNWHEQGSFNKHFLFVIRIFYEVISGGLPEEIEMKDFFPDAVERGGIFKLPKYEPFSNVVRKASEWCGRQSGLRFCNAQSLEIKIKRGKEVNTQKMDYMERGSSSNFYVRILRVAYTKSSSHLSIEQKVPSSIRELSCKTFVPVQLSTAIFMPEFETLTETKNRVSAWIKATGAHVISAETAALRIFTGGEAKNGTEASFTFNVAERNEYWIFVIRLYLNGLYKEPPPEMLPPIPELQDSGCCVTF